MGDELLELLPEDFLAGRAVPQEMIVALRVIAKIDSGTAGRIAEYLSTLQGITSENEVREGIQNLLGEADADAAASILQTLLNVKPDDVSRTVNLLDRWRKSSEERRRFFTDEQFTSLTGNLQALVAEYPSISLLRKASYLVRSVGNELDEIACFCDLRPVFDKTRKNIDGFVMLANLRMMYRSQDGIQHAFELALTEGELRDVIKASSDALSKMEVLKATSATFRQGIRK